MAYEPTKPKPAPIITVVPGAVPGIIEQRHISEGAVKSEQIKDASIESRDISAQAIETHNIKDRAITKYKIGLQQVEAEHLAPDSVIKTRIAAGAVGERELSDGAIITKKILDGQVTSAKLGPDVGLTVLGTGAVKTIHLAAGAVTEDKLATDSVTAGKIKASAVGQSELGTNSVVEAKIANGAITPAKINPNYALFQARVPLDIHDFDETHFTLNSNWHNDGLDLSGIVPAGAKAVLLEIVIQSSIGTPALQLRRDAVSGTYSFAVPVQVTDIANTKQLIIPIDADLKLDYMGSDEITLLTVAVVGWYI